ncbi:unnamed protein product [Clonostachys solani]|uniref:Rhodopsin domain-containing protein n=1 Tax=Clonostachys solani TaxID=160281 RepID=A0A9P0EJM7_9HYPO|nr:unnamed protein product [Clonostachys solani]
MASAAAELTPEEAAAAAAAAAAAQAFNIEVWTLLGIGALVTFLRIVARTRSVGFRKLQPDDYLVIVGLIFYGIESGLAYSVGAHAHGIANNGMTDAQREALSTDDPEHKLRVIGSIIQLCGWNSYSVILWAFKASWLVFYIRLTDGIGKSYLHRIYVGFGLVVGSWLIVVVNIFLGCRPFHRYWQINPDPGNVCQPAVSNQIVWVCYAFNVTTDMYLLSIPLPMLWSSRLQTWKKLGLLFLFSGGIFVMVCGTLRAVIIVTDPVNGAQLAGSWAVRETFVALVTTNLPHIFPLLKVWFGPVIDTLVSTARKSSNYSSNSAPKGFRTFGGGGSSGPSWRGRGPPTANPITNFTLNESEERMVGENNGGKSSSVRLEDMHATRTSDGGSPGSKVRIHKSVQVDIVTEDRQSRQTDTPDLGDSIREQPWLQAQLPQSASIEGSTIKRSASKRAS